ncbi:collagenase [Streptomyces sp. 1222.5]|uniref:collagenase n=1 Tax=Streptomyces sp. 1222.5 TaxID=1881026 RepID=UPI003EBE413C
MTAIPPSSRRAARQRLANGVRPSTGRHRATAGSRSFHARWVSVLCLVLLSGAAIFSVPDGTENTKVPKGKSVSGPGAQPTTQPRRLNSAHVPPPPPPPASSAQTTDDPPQTTGNTTSCPEKEFGRRTGSALVLLVKEVPTSCINSLFSATSTDTHRAFQQSNMMTIADAYKLTAGRYRGNNADGVQQLALFLRAGYYLQSNHPKAIGPYDARLTAAVTTGLDTFFAQPHSGDVSASNGDTLREMITLTDSVGQQGRYLNVYQRLLSHHSRAYDSIGSMVRAVNEVYRPLWRGNWNPAYVRAVQSNPRIIEALYKFALANTQRLGTDLASLDSNAGMNLARYAAHPRLQPTVRPLVKALLRKTSAAGPTAGLWMAVASQVASYDSDNCAYYGVCDLFSKVTRTVLPITRRCDPNITIRAQALTTAELDTVCASVLGQNAYFRSAIKVAGVSSSQHVSAVQLVVFASFIDYQTYASAIYGIDTDNGGKTLTGNPSDPTNHVTSIMFQKASDDGFAARIWNLNHEFTHYLDTRDNMRGDFDRQTSVPNLWWIEGVAEYVSYSYRNVEYDLAIQEAARHTYKLSTLFESTAENSDQVRTYPWGYLAVRYMLEKHPTDVERMLTRFRAGDYTGGYGVYHEDIGTRYDADFDQWLATCATGACVKPPTPWPPRITSPLAGEPDADEGKRNARNGYPDSSTPQATASRAEGQYCKVGVFGGCVYGEQTGVAGPVGPLRDQPDPVTNQTNTMHVVAGTRDGHRTQEGVPSRGAGDPRVKVSVGVVSANGAALSLAQSYLVFTAPAWKIRNDSLVRSRPLCTAARTAPPQPTYTVTAPAFALQPRAGPNPPRAPGESAQSPRAARHPGLSCCSSSMA